MKGLIIKRTKISNAVAFIFNLILVYVVYFLCLTPLELERVKKGDVIIQYNGFIVGVGVAVDHPAYAEWTLVDALIVRDYNAEALDVHSSPLIQLSKFNIVA